MRSSLVRAATAAGLATVFALVCVVPAGFANDLVVVDFNKYGPFELTPGGILCQDTHAVIQYTQTPSGNFSAVYNAQYRLRTHHLTATRHSLSKPTRSIS